VNTALPAEAAELLGKFLACGSFPQLDPVISACTSDAPTEQRVRAVTAFLGTSQGRALRGDIGRWLTTVIAIENLVPGIYGDWRLLVQDSMAFVLSKLSARRLAAKLVEQFELPFDTTPERRLMRLIAKMPGIEKMGQVLARNRHLIPSLREALTELENGMSDVEWPAIRGIIEKQLGPRLEQYSVEVDSSILCEASVSAVVRFTWLNPDTREGERGVFKVLKPYVPPFFEEDMTLLQRLSAFLAKNRNYGVGAAEIAETVADVRLLLEHELDFRREQATLVSAFNIYRLNPGIRVPRPIPQLCTPVITAMTEEQGVKVTSACRRSPAERRRIAEKIVEALIAVPLLAREESVLLHADPHAGNLFYNEHTRELIILDWALTEQLTRQARRHLAMLVIMTILRDLAGVAGQIAALSVSARDSPAQVRLIERSVRRFFEEFPPGQDPGALDAMQLLDTIAIEGVRFPASLAMFRKVLFTLDGVLHDVAGADVHMDRDIMREFVLRLVTSFGVYFSPLTFADLFAIEKSGLLYPLRSWAWKRLGPRWGPLLEGRAG
jgi:ubiquinone biosynthesis protein